MRLVYKDVMAFNSLPQFYNDHNFFDLQLIIMLDKEFKFFLESQDEFIKQYPDKFIVIKNFIVIGTYKSNSEAYLETCKTEAAGSFLIQHCKK